jgi:hypothetical protein
VVIERAKVLKAREQKEKRTEAEKKNRWCQLNEKPRIKGTRQRKLQALAKTAWATQMLSLEIFCLGRSRQRRDVSGRGFPPGAPNADYPSARLSRLLSMAFVGIRRRRAIYLISTPPLFVALALESCRAQ